MKDCEFKERYRKFGTPCVGVCSTIYGDETCLGCKRNFLDIIKWNGYTKEQKDEIIKGLYNE